MADNPTTTTTTPKPELPHHLMMMIRKDATDLARVHAGLKWQRWYRGSVLTYKYEIEKFIDMCEPLRARRDQMKRDWKKLGRPDYTWTLEDRNYLCGEHIAAELAAKRRSNSSN